MTSDPEIVISGGGPVGMALAIGLGLRGVPCTVVERYPEPQPIPKGQNLTQRTMEHFRSWGIEAELRARRAIAPDAGNGGMTSYGTLFGPYRYDWLQRGLVRPFYHADSERLPQYETEAVLRARAATLPAITTLYGWTVEDAAQDADGVHLTVAERNGPGRRTLRAAYAAGCDGSRSVLREAAGITQTRSDHDRVMVLLVFRSAELDRLLRQFPGKSFFNVLHPDLQGYWRFFGRVDGAGTWFFHAPVPPGTTAANTDYAALLQEAAGAPFDVDLMHVGFWDLRFAVADRYRAGRIFVAGDAAHSHPPYGGYGINTGFEDAVNLAWKLSAVRDGWAGEALLDSYDAERRPVFQSTARDFIERAIESDRAFLASHDPARDRPEFERRWAERGAGAAAEVGAFEPNYAGSPVVCGAPGTPSAVGHHAFAARPGHHLPPQDLGTGRTAFGALGPGFTLFADPASPEADRFAAAAAALGIPLTVVPAPGATGWEAGAVLVRPDQFVAWTAAAAVHADDRHDASAVLRRAAGRTT